jgi:group I intron endonuclease
MAIGVYQIENIINGKRYVGSAAQNSVQRWAQHLCDLRKGIHANARLQNAYSKYGESALKFSVLEIVETPDECIIMEQLCIDTLDPEYNIRKVADSNYGLKRSEESRARMRAAHRGTTGKHYSEESKARMREARAKQVFTEEDRAAMSKAHIGRKRPAEELAKFSATMEGHPVSEETRAKISAANKGKHNHALGRQVSEETKAKIGAANKGKTHPPISEETRRRMSAGQKGKHPGALSEEHRARISATKKGCAATMLGQHHSEEAKAKMRTARIGKTITEETKRKMSESAKKSWEQRRCSDG